MKKNNRKSIPKKTEAKLLLNSRRRCALCFKYEQDFKIKKGQIAHIDRNSDNNNENNLVFLCLPHHDDYDAKPSQSKRWTEKELVESKNSLMDFIKEEFDMIPIDADIQAENKERESQNERSIDDRTTITTEVYNLRIPIYYAYRELVLKILRETKISLSDLLDFANKTHEALFLYDENIEHYLNDIFKKANHFRSLSDLIEHPQRVEDDKWSEVVNEESDLLIWFNNNMETTRKRFKQYLHLS